MEKVSLFEISLYRVYIKEWKDKKDYILSLIPFDNKEAIDENISFADYWIGNDIPEYGNAVNEIIKPYIDDFYKVAPYKFQRLTKMWCHRYNMGDYFQPHTHGPIGYSAILYAEYDDKKHKSTRFFSPFMAEYGECDNKSLNIKEGDLIIFPSNLSHMAPPNYSNIDRTIISFNLN
tara:strand:+ start:60 stop:587 length:528 start_codon:yes stop_codon:yes gene_type:complete